MDVDALWHASELVDEHIGDEPVTPLAPRIAVRAAEYRLPAGLVAALDQHLRAHAAGDRIDEVLDELDRVRSETGWPPLAAPIGQILASQALVHVLSASRYQTVVDELRELLGGRYGSPPGPVDATVRRAVELLGGEQRRGRRSTSVSSASSRASWRRARRTCCCSRSSARKRRALLRRSARAAGARRR